MAIGGYAEAVKVWTEIKSLFSPFPEGVYVRLADSLLMLNEFEAAEHELALCLKNNPEYPPALVTREKIAQARQRVYLFKKTQIDHDDAGCIDTQIGMNKLANVCPLKLTGWVLVGPGEQNQVVLEGQDGFLEHHALTVPRPDVVAYLGTKNIVCEVLCGFSLTVNLTRLRRLGVVRHGTIQWLYEFSGTPQLQVLRGKDNWLFLANDSNKSVDQYVGLERLSDETKAEWAEYFVKLADFSQRYRTCFLIAPNKESVFGEFHPYERAETSIVDQILSAAPSDLQGVLYPVQTLRADSKSYCKTDSHWTYKGAFLAAQEVLAQFGYTDPIDDLFDFHEKAETGDLGNKLDPVERDMFTKARAKSSPGRPVFQSHTMRNAGRVIIYQNAEPVIDGKLLIFGSSFCDNLSPIFARIFREVVFSYNPAAPCTEVLDAEQPDYVLLETSERFLLRTPVFTSTLAETSLKVTLDSLSKEERKSAVSNIALERHKNNVFSDFILKELL